MSNISVGFVGTESFYDNYSLTYLDNMEDTCKSIWESEIEDGSGDYKANFYVVDSDGIEIPESALCGSPNNSSCTTRERAGYADDWLRIHKDLYYASYDVIIIGDYYNNRSDENRAIAQSTAGTQTDKCCLLDIPEIEYDTSQSGSLWQDIGYSGVAAHELMHMFLDESPGYEHRAYTDYYGDTSIQYDPDSKDWCAQDATPNKVIEDVSWCTKGNVRDWIDNHSSRF